MIIYDRFPLVILKFNDDFRPQNTVDAQAVHSGSVPLNLLLLIVCKFDDDFLDSRRT